MKPISIKDCWAKGFSVEETSERTHYTKQFIINYFKKCTREMKEYFKLEKEKK